MKIYLVGGAVRDQLLGLPVKEKDWVVVGSTPNEMRKNKFKQVGKDFPVFIHTKTGEEYALARTERKSGHGYTGFEFDTNPNVTLEEDLARRDLTINAIAQDEDGTLIDPYNGQDDIKNKKLRHVSDAFSEDPLRVLRVARFHANLRNFTVVPETMDKIKEIVESGELEYLTPERIWLEMYKTEEDLLPFFRFLGKCNALNGLFPEIILNPKEPLKCYWPNNPTNVEVIAVHMFNHINADEIPWFCQRLKIPNEYKELALLLDNCFDEYVSYAPDNIDGYDKLLSIVKKLDIRKEDRLKSFMSCVYASEVIDGFKGHKVFFEELIYKIKTYKLSLQDQKKAGSEIKKIIENAHREIAQGCLKNILNKSD
jgi:tRNA nucleotidyltransferase (CCA-adding enzyme)